MNMKEITRTLENLLAAAYRSYDCPAPDILQEILLGKAKTSTCASVLEHVKSCGYCQYEIKALAQISGIKVPAELLGYESMTLAQIEEKTRKAVQRLMPRELTTFTSLWQLAMVHGFEASEPMPLATAAFSSSSHSRAARIIHAALLLGAEPDATRLDAVAKALRLTPKERAALSAEFIQ
jgi:hypothetical protein